MSAFKHRHADYLNGLTPRCLGYNMPAKHGCGRRVATMEATLCNSCLISKNNDDFKEAFARPGEKWYLEWAFHDDRDPQGCKTFICRTCGQRMFANEFGVPGADGILVPAVACCVQTSVCKLAKEFWGEDGNATFHVMRDYVRNVHALK